MFRLGNYHVSIVSPDDTPRFGRLYRLSDDRRTVELINETPYAIKVANYDVLGVSFMITVDGKILGEWVAGSGETVVIKRPAGEDKQLIFVAVTSDIGKSCGAKEENVSTNGVVEIRFSPARTQRTRSRSRERSDWKVVVDKLKTKKASGEWIIRESSSIKTYHPEPSSAPAGFGFKRESRPGVSPPVFGLGSGGRSVGGSSGFGGGGGGGSGGLGGGGDVPHAPFTFRKQRSSVVDEAYDSPPSYEEAAAASAPVGSSSTTEAGVTVLGAKTGQSFTLADFKEDHACYGVIKFKMVAQRRIAPDVLYTPLTGEPAGGEAPSK